MNIFLKGANGNAMPASQNLGSDYCCSGAGAKTPSQKTPLTAGSSTAQALFSPLTGRNPVARPIMPQPPAEKVSRSAF
ncbi:hypothetical protein PYV50_02960 [Pseudomonas sp. H22_DOA]|nr:hypothetical protein PYV50_02960 [Pseudomonas sp. H22_DOA]